MAVGTRHGLIPVVALLGVAVFLAGGGPGIQVSPSRGLAVSTARAASCPPAPPASPAATAGSSGLSTPATPLPLPAAVPIGRPAAFGPLELTVTGVERLRCVVGPRTLVPRGVFLAVTFRVVATGPLEGEGEFPVADLRVADRRGDAVGPALDATAALSYERRLPIPMLAPLTPGVPMTVVVVFDVPRDATALVLTSVDDAFAVRLARSTADTAGG